MSAALLALTRIRIVGIVAVIVSLLLIDGLLRTKRDNFCADFENGGYASYSCTLFLYQMNQRQISFYGEHDGRKFRVEYRRLR